MTFLPLQTSTTIIVDLLGDTLDEVNETFFVHLLAPVNAALGDAVGQGTIADNDLPPAVSINDVMITEGNNGTNAMVFTVSLARASGQTVAVQFFTADETALAGEDYVAKLDALTFSPGTTTRTLSVQVYGDLIKEMAETFLVQLFTATNAVLGDPQGVGTIQDNDSVPSVSSRMIS